jgi:hypothetical protein
MSKTTTEAVLSEQLVEDAAKALAASEGYDWAFGSPAVQKEFRRQARVAVGAALEYIVKHNIMLTS